MGYDQIMVGGWVGEGGGVFFIVVHVEVCVCAGGGRSRA